MPRRDNVHVSKTTGVGWRVSQSGETISTHNTQKNAVVAARREARLSTSSPMVGTGEFDRRTATVEIPWLRGRATGGTCSCGKWPCDGGEHLAGFSTAKLQTNLSTN